MNHNQVLDQAREFVVKNLPALCNQLQARADGSILSQESEFVRLALMLRAIAPINFSMAEAMIQRAAVEHVVALNRHSEFP
jgi:hypothetical protein